MVEDQNFYKDIIDNLYDGVYFVDRQRSITYWNKGAERITGYDSAQVVGHFCHDNLLNHVTANGIQLCFTNCPLAACMEDGNPREADIFLHHADGHRLPVLVRAAPLRDADGVIIGAVETFSRDLGDKTVRRELQELRRAVQMDRLTGIGNRLYLEGRLSAVLAEIGRKTGTLAGLLFIDIDHFKKFNDQYGHNIGDRVLRIVSATMHHNLRKSDVIGRWGGEEFVAILYDVESFEELYNSAEKLRALIEHSHLDVDGMHLNVTVSVGATLFLPDDSAESVIQRADALMYQIKQIGRNQVKVG